jgi:hypothetical protein
MPLATAIRVAIMHEIRVVTSINTAIKDLPGALARGFHATRALQESGQDGAEILACLKDSHNHIFGSLKFHTHFGGTEVTEPTTQRDPITINGNDGDSVSPPYYFRVASISPDPVMPPFRRPTRACE